MATRAQDYSNHRQVVPGFHGLTLVLILLLGADAVRGLLGGLTREGVLKLVEVGALGLIYYYLRSFATGLQDRIIRLEEYLRYRDLLPAELRARVGDLTISQVIALRFAPDDELRELIEQVLAGQLQTPDQIKRAVRFWRPDPMRI